MTQPFSYQATFVLDKQHFQECYDQTATIPSGWQPYLKALILLAMSVLFMTVITTSAYIAYFLLVLAAVEALGIYYHRAWWVFRQMLSRAANNQVNLTIDEQGISTHTSFNQQQFLWSVITDLEKSDQGWLFSYQNQRQYLSDRCLDASAQQFLSEQGNAVK